MQDNGDLLLTHFHSFERLSDQPHSNQIGVRSELSTTASRSPHRKTRSRWAIVSSPPLFKQHWKAMWESVPSALPIDS
ncbi:hypothetical protein XENTR_v10016694 [Xenopus tropicalis]|nr:hypothetical protein XENTR_v10016694 [Xenopus tropicalis]